MKTKTIDVDLDALMAVVIKLGASDARAIMNVLGLEKSDLINAEYPKDQTQALPSIRITLDLFSR